MWRITKQKRTNSHNIGVLFVLGLFSLISLSSTFVVLLPKTALAAPTVNCTDVATYNTTAALQSCLTSNAAPILRMTPEEQVKSFLYKQALAGCFAQADLSSGTSFGVGDDYIKAADVNSTKTWFYGDVTNGGQFAFIGPIIDSVGDDSKVYCGGDDQDWIGEALSLWSKYGGPNWAGNPRQALCDFGLNLNGGNGGTYADCLAGGDLDTQGSNEDGANHFRDAIQKYVYGNNSTSLSRVQEYLLFRDSFIKGCRANNTGKDFNDPATTATDKATVNLDNGFKLSLVDNTGKLTETIFTADKNKSDTVHWQVNNDYLPARDRCDDLVTRANDRAGDYKTYVNLLNGLPPDVRSAFGMPTAGPNINNTVGTSPELNCSVKLLNPLSWFLCPLATAMMSLASGLDNQINNFLEININDPGSPNEVSAYRSSWAVVRNLSIGLIVIAGLVAIIAQALGFELLDAYTLRKAIPRLLIVVMGIALSWPLMMWLIQLTNDLGIGVRQLIYAPFHSSGGINLDVQLGGGGQVVLGLITGAAITALGFVALLSFAATAALAAAIAFLILTLRQMVIVMLVIFAPIAIVCYVLPNTQKVWKVWWESFSKGLLMFPIIAAFIAIGRVFAAVSSSGSAGSIQQIVAFTAYFAPYFLIPFAFRLAGGVLSTLAGFVNDRNKGAFDRLKKFRQKEAAERGARLNRRVTLARTGAVRNLRGRASLKSTSGIGRMAYRGLAGAIGGYNVEALSSAQQAMANKQIDDQKATGADGAIRGTTVNLAAIKAQGGFQAVANEYDRQVTSGGPITARARVEKGMRQYQSAGGAWINEADVLEGDRRWGRDHYAQQAALTYEMTKAMEDGDVQNIADSYASLAKDQWKMSDIEADSAWIGSGFAVQGQHLEYKNTKMEYVKRNSKTGKGGNKLDGTKLLKEAYEKKGSYPLSQMSAHTIKQITAAYSEAEQQYTADPTNTEAKQSMDRARAVAETFMHQMGGGQMGEAEGVPIRAPDGKISRQAGGSGSGAVNEAVRVLAERTGIYRTPPTSFGRGGQQK